MNCCIDDNCLSKEDIKKLKWVLYFIFFVNAVMFFLEFSSGIVSNSNALIADSLDMFADAFVYGISLFVISRSHKVQAKASLIKGMIMLTLGVYVFIETFFKIINPSVPHADTITFIGILALFANIICFLLLTKHKDKNINLNSSWICSRNDMFANVSVIFAGVFVGIFNSMWPDILVGVGIAGIILYFSFQIIKESIKHI